MRSNSVVGATRLRVWHTFRFPGLWGKRPMRFLQYSPMLLCSALAYPAAAGTLVTNFDSLPEGFAATSIVDGGITFSSLNTRLDGSTIGNFVVESTDSPFFAPAPPNYLTTIGYVPGPGYSFGRFGSALLNFGPVAADAVSIDILSTGIASPNLTLDALLNGVIMGTETIDFGSNSAIEDQSLSLSGTTFDQLQLTASGPQDQGVVFIGVSTVTIDLVPEPETALFVGAGLVGLIGVRRARCPGR